MKMQALMLKELRSENPRVGGSIPPLGTIQGLAPQGFQPSGNLGRSGTLSVHEKHENRHSDAAPELRWKNAALAWHWIERYAAGIDTEPQLDRILDCVEVRASSRRPE